MIKKKVIKPFRRDQSVLSIREQLNAIVDRLDRLTPLRSPDFRLVERADGWFYKRKRPQKRLFEPGFIVQSAGTSLAKIRPNGSVVGGLGDVIVPDIGGTSLFTDPNPTITVADGEILALKVEIEPATEEYETGKWRFLDSGFTVTGDRIEVVSESTLTDVFPNIDQSDGSTTTGVYHVPLAKVAVTDGVVSFPYKYYAEKGPLSFKFCSSGLLTVLGAIQVNVGSFQTFEDDP